MSGRRQLSVSLYILWHLCIHYHNVTEDGDPQILCDVVTPPPPKQSPLLGSFSPCEDAVIYIVTALQRSCVTQW